MSRAFTKEVDDAPAVPVRRRGVPVPVPNLVTEVGLRALRAELAAGEGDADRMRELSEHLATAEIGTHDDAATVGFGVHVTVERDDGERATYHLVGAIEADVKRGAISWRSPLAIALWSARVGDVVQLPRGDDVRVVAIAP